MRLLRSLLLATTFMAAGAPALQAQITPVNFPSTASPGTLITGPVTNIDPVNQMVQVKDPVGIIQTFRMDQHIEIFKNGSPVQLHNLSLGDVVTIVTK